MNDAEQKTPVLTVARTENTEGQKTPQWLRDEMEQICINITGVGFDADAAGSRWNKQCEKVITRETDTTKVDWLTYGKNFFLNPPHNVNEIGPIVNKAIKESQSGCTVGLIVPVWTNYEWCTELIRLGQVHEIVGLVFFEDFHGNKVVCNKGPRQIRVIFLGPNVKAGTNGPPIYAPRRADMRSRTNGAATDGSSVEPGTNGSSQARNELNGSSHQRLRLKELASVRSKRTTWLWHRRIPLGELTTCDGDPADNKSSLLSDIAARVSTGRPMPDGSEGVLL